MFPLINHTESWDTGTNAGNYFQIDALENQDCQLRPNNLSVVGESLYLGSLESFAWDSDREKFDEEPHS